MLPFTCRQSLVGLLLLCVSFSSQAQEPEYLPKRGNPEEQRRAPLGNRFRMSMFHSLLGRDEYEYEYEDDSDLPPPGELYKDKRSRSQESRSKAKLYKHGGMYYEEGIVYKGGKHHNYDMPANIPTIPTPTAGVPTIGAGTQGHGDSPAAPLPPTYNVPPYMADDDDYAAVHGSKASKGSRGQKGMKGGSAKMSSSTKMSQMGTKGMKPKGGMSQVGTIFPTHDPTMVATETGTVETVETVTIRVPSKLEVGFFPEATIREANQTEIDGLLVQTSRFYSDVLTAVFKNFDSFNASFVDSGFNPNASLPVSVLFDANADFRLETSTPGSFIPTEFEVYIAMQTADYQLFITNYVWESEPKERSIFFETQIVMYSSPVINVTTMAPNTTVAPILPPNVTVPPNNPNVTVPPILPNATTTPLIPGATTTPVVPGATTTPVVPGATTTPVVPGATTTPVVPGATTTPVVPGATTPPLVPGATTTPVVPGATTTPVVPGATTTPVVPGATTPPLIPAARL